MSVSTSKTDNIKVTSILDGEYQNDFQVEIKEDNNILKLSLEQLTLGEIIDDKRNAHKVIAATLQLEIPEGLSIYILSDIGSANLNGNFESLFIELVQGQCKVEGDATTATINTLDGDISVKTKHAIVEANSNHGKIKIDKSLNTDSNSQWKLKSINGNITVAKRE